MKLKRYVWLPVVIIAVIVYVGAYAWFRSRRELVHHKTWAGNNNMHRVEAAYPDGRLVFIGALLAAGDETGGVDQVVFSNAVNTVGHSLQRRHDALQILFTPLRWAESIGWEIVDGRKD